MDKKDIKNRFTYHKPQGNQQEVYENIRNFAKDFADFLNDNVEDSRELSIAITKLEESVFWANASIARNYTDGRNYPYTTHS